MKKAYQLSLMLGAIEDYEKEVIDIGTLVGKIGGIIAVIEEENFEEDIFDSYFTLEQVNARIYDKDFDFEENGKLFVSRALLDIRNKINMHIYLINKEIVDNPE